MVARVETPPSDDAASEEHGEEEREHFTEELSEEDVSGEADHEEGVTGEDDLVAVQRDDDVPIGEQTIDASSSVFSSATKDLDATTASNGHGGFTAATATATGGAFSDNLPSTDDSTDINSWLSSTVDSDIASSAEAPSASEWTVGMALDATIDDDKPSLAVKATRFWMATAAAVSSDSHYDQDNLDRMAKGKAPRRNNPRSGRKEAMQLTGLRQASEPSEVRMQWPGDAVDPWSAT